MMVQLPVLSAFCFFLLSLGAAGADKDDSYYVLGTGNPNVNEKMYWKDAENVLQDLSQFSALYVRFHHCAWTWNQNKNNADEGVEENDYWYMGKIPPMEANVAFSLYGQLSGGSFNGCGKDSFINSFYTTSGFNNFTSAMKSAGMTGFSSSTTYTAECYGGFGVGCDGSGGFALHQYSSNLCAPNDVTKTTNTLATLNSAMKSAQCIQIYNKARSHSSSSSYDDDDGSSSRSGTPLALLDYSAACFYQNVFSPEGNCPDPYGMIAYYKTNFYKDIVKSHAQRPVSVYKQKMVYEEKIKEGKSRGQLGAGLLSIAALVLIVDKLVFDCILPGSARKTTSLAGGRHDDEEGQTPTVRTGSEGDYEADGDRFM